MNKDQFAPSTENHLEHHEKINPFDKLIDSDQLTYLPNLYLRSHKAIEELIKIRQDYPQQRILLSRQQTKWDNLLDQIKLSARIMKEQKKHRIAQKSYLCRQARMQIQRNSLRCQQHYYFHRLISSHLSQSIIDAFQQSLGQPIKDCKQQMKEQQKQTVIKKPQDDIFVQQEDYCSQTPKQNFLGDLLQDPIIEEKQQYIEKFACNILPISSYIQEKYRQNYEILRKQPSSAISRKGVLRKINENVRKRLKIKQEEEQIAGRSLSSATVFLSSLLNNQWESKATNLIDLNIRTDWLSSSEKHRKKKEQEVFQLRWNSQQTQSLQKRNDKQLIKKGLIDSNVLSLYIMKEQEQYRKIFDKNIKADKSFPPTIKNIKEVTLVHPIKYYNEFHDKDYELFIMKYNKRKLFKDFTQQSHMIFPENYYHQDEMDSAETINVGKLFVHPPQKVLNRIIYKVKGNNNVDLSIKSDLNKSNLDTNKMIIMAFLVNKYLSIFGNNWENITMLLMMHPIFANYFLTKQTVQHIYQLVQRNSHEQLQEINLWDKKILPFDYYGCQSYTQFETILHHCTQAQPYHKYNSTMDLQLVSNHDQDIDLNNYESMLNQDIQQTKQELYTDIQQELKFFSTSLKEDTFKDNNTQNQLYNRISRTLTTFKNQSQLIQYEVDSDIYKEEQPNKIYQEILNSVKAGQVKSCFPIRKKKNINERNNQLVKILQALRSKGNTLPPLQKKPDQPNKGISHTAAIAKQPAPSIAAPSSSQQPIKAPTAEQPHELKKSNLTKSPQKASQKKLGAPSKKDKKGTKDPQDKK